MEKSEIVSTPAVACKTDAKGEEMSGDSLFSNLYVEGLFTNSLKNYSQVAPLFEPSLRKQGDKEAVS